MKTLFKTLFFLSFILIISCNKEEAQLTPADPLTGYWINPVYDGGQTTLEKANDFKEDGYGVAFNEDGTMIERNIAGGCATPPVSYHNYEGTWSQDDMTLDLTLDWLWIEPMDLQWEIVELDHSKLKNIRN